MLSISDLPTVNAVLNGISALLLIAGYLCIRQRLIPAHRLCMSLAFGTSALFLISYLIYHSSHGTTRFTGQGWVRPAYFLLLTSHTILATGIVPLAVTTLSRAWKGQFDRHRRIARWTFPIWLYVSITGVAVYWMLYRLYPAG